MGAGQQDAEDLADLLVAHRSRSGLTQEQLAGLSTVSIRTIRNLERGLGRPRRDTIRLLANALRLEGSDRLTFERAGSAREQGGDEHALSSRPHRWTRVALVSLAVLATLVVAGGAALWSLQRQGSDANSNAAAAVRCVRAGNFTDRLYVGDCLRVDDALSTQAVPGVNGGRRWYRLTLQKDFNLVLYDVIEVSGQETSRLLWESGTAGCGRSAGHGPGFAILRTDGNLVLYSDRGAVAWAADTINGRSSYLAIENGNVALYDTSSRLTSDARGWSRGCRIAGGNASTCPPSWFCFYEHEQFNGRRVQFRDCGVQNLTDFGFDRQASSWVNSTSSPVDVYGAPDGGGERLWHEEPLSSSSYVGVQSNDRASSFRRLC